MLIYSALSVTRYYVIERECQIVRNLMTWLSEFPSSKFCSTFIPGRAENGRMQRVQFIKELYNLDPPLGHQLELIIDII